MLILIYNRFSNKSKLFLTRITCFQFNILLPYILVNISISVGAGTSSRPCSEIYRGPSAFSEPESKALKSAIESVQDRLQV